MSIFKRKPKASALMLLAEELGKVTEAWSGRVSVSKRGDEIQVTLKAADMDAITTAIKSTARRLP